MLFLSALLLACTPDPLAVEARQYVVDLDPILQENGLVAERLLIQAAAAYDGKVQPRDTRLAWTADIVPLAEHLRDQAVAVQAPASWTQDHKELVDIWTRRADGYRDLAESVDTGDPALFKDGRAKADNAKVDEETWFRDTNARLEPFGLYVDQFP